MGQPWPVALTVWQ